MMYFTYGPAQNYVRTITQGVTLTDTHSHWGAFIRGLRVNAGSTAETKRIVDYFRINKDTVKAIGLGLRSLFMVVRIVSRVIFRDYILRRFLRAKEDLVLKSPICREIKLDSRID